VLLLRSPRHQLLEKLVQIHRKHPNFAQAAKDGPTTFKVRCHWQRSHLPPLLPAAPLWRRWRCRRALPWPLRLTEAVVALRYR